jgi:hypothetical protein
MEKGTSVVVESEVKTLREGIRNKYNEYHLADRDRFPDFEYNTNKANYQPLKNSFEEEFYVVREMSRVDNNIHIPSTKTLALIFCDDSYVPGKKIFNTCRSYAEGRSKAAINQVSSVTTEPKTTQRARTGIVLAAGLVLVSGIAIYVAMHQLKSSPPASGLVINHPYQSQLVPRQPIIEGRVSNADTVWVVVRPVGWNRYYVQPPIKVNDDGTWKGKIYIGSAGKESIGATFHIRAFVDPAGPYKVLEDYERDVFAAWPDAQLSTEEIEVVRGGENE